MQESTAWAAHYCLVVCGDFFGQQMTSEPCQEPQEVKFALSGQRALFDGCGPFWFNADVTVTSGLSLGQTRTGELWCEPLVSILPEVHFRGFTFAAVCDNPVLVKTGCVSTRWFLSLRSQKKLMPAGFHSWPYCQPVGGTNSAKMHTYPRVTHWITCILISVAHSSFLAFLASIASEDGWRPAPVGLLMWWKCYTFQNVCATEGGI